MYAQYHVIEIDGVLVRDGRPFDPDTVERLKASMAEVGLLHPISVQRPAPNVPPFWLVAGRNRLEAARQLGWDTIRAIELPFGRAGNDLAMMAEIAENLHRREITALERNELQARWLEIVEREKADQSREVRAIEGSKRADGKGHRKPSGIKQAARELGVPATNLRQSRKIAALSDAAKDAAREHGLDDNQSALLAAAKEREPEKQVEAITRRASSAMKREPAPVAEHPAPDGYGSWEAWRDAIVQAGAMAPAGIRASIRKAFS